MNIKTCFITQFSKRKIMHEKQVTILRLQSYDNYKNRTQINLFVA